MLGYCIFSIVAVTVLYIIADIILSRPLTDTDRKLSRMDEELDKEEKE